MTNADPKARTLWLFDLRNNGVTDATIRHGLTASGALDMPPSPGKFATLCYVADGLPTPQEAYRDATHGKYPHQVVYEAARRVGLWELRHWSDTQARKEFMPVYDKVCAEYRAGARWELPVEQRLERKKPVPVSPEVARQHIAATRAALAKAPDYSLRKLDPVEPLSEEQFLARVAADEQALTSAAQAVQGEVTA